MRSNEDRRALNKVWRLC